MAIEDDFLLEQLVGMGFIDDEQSAEARSRAIENGISVTEAVEKLGYATEDEILGALAMEYGMETFDLDGYRIPDDVIQSLPGDVAKRYGVVPVMRHENQLMVAIPNPTNLETVDSLRYVLHMDIDPVVVKRSQIQTALQQYYGDLDQQVNQFMQDVTSGELEIVDPGDLDVNSGDVDKEGDEAPIVRLVSLIIVEAYRQDASDIHLEPMEKRFRIRYRIDGALHEVEPPPKYLQNNILQRLKIMAKLDISERRVPQDGKISFHMPGKSIDLRVSSVPTVHGESIVMRILDQSNISLGIPDLGFYEDDQKLIKKILALPDGIFLVTGPTGSGKSTSLYTFLNELNTPNRKIITAEDPVEYELSGINQVNCDNRIGMTFSRALRAMLRQSPNIIMVGEIRDIETGAIAVNAALTGHLVFSTLHTNDAPTAVSRMIDMGVKPFLVASGVRAVMAQRLLRRNCKHCKVPVEPKDEELVALELERDFFADAECMAGEGCSECKHGYKGRIGIYEIFMVDEEMVRLILEASPADIIKEAAVRAGMRTLRDDALRKAMSGVSTLAEVIRVTKSDEEEAEEADIAEAAAVATEEAGNA